jgi:hypothetical protein
LSPAPVLVLEENAGNVYVDHKYSRYWLDPTPTPDAVAGHLRKVISGVR